MSNAKEHAGNALSQTELRALIPHAGTMCLLEGVSCWDKDSIECLALSHRDPANPLRRDGVLPIVAGIEYAAQAMAVHGGLVESGPGPRIGYLAVLTGVEWSVQQLDDCPGPLRVCARRLAVIATGSQYAFRVLEAERLLLAGEAVIAFA
jgi:predicted hotdog family 3-hydroxylacyl-ACP dehydratase